MSSCAKAVAAGLLLLGLFGSPWSWMGYRESWAALSSAGSVPAEFQALYAELQWNLEAFERGMEAPSGTSRVTFAAELLAANAHRGEALLAPNALAGSLVYLDALASLGVRGVKVYIGYPLLSPDFPRSQEYLAFYKQLAQEIRRRGMSLLVATGAMFTDPAFSFVPIDYSGLTFEQLKEGRRQVAQLIAREIRPDYLTVGNEPTTEARNTGLQELRDPRRYAEMIRYILEGLERGTTLMGAGTGNWEDPTYIQLLAAMPAIDYIDLHIYPIVRGTLRRTVELAQIARAYGKRVIVGEAWLYKVGAAELGRESWSEAFRRDVFSFWAPLDQKFLEVVVKLAQAQGIEFLSAFWSKYFFAYLEYNEETRRLPYPILRERVDRAAAQNILAGRLTPTGARYRELIAQASGL